MIPVIAGIAAGLLPSVVSALFGAKNEKQAREAVAPQYDAMVSQYVGRGMNRQDASAKADEDIKGAVSEKMGEGAIPPWLELALSVPAYFAGAGLAKAGMKAAGKGIGKLAGAEVKAAKNAIPEGPKSITGHGREVAVGKGDPTKFHAGSAGEAGEAMPPRGGAPTARDAELEVMPQAQEHLGMQRPFGKLDYREPIGSAAPPMPKSPRELFREEIASAERGTMDTASPQMMRRPFDRLPYNEEEDIAAQMRRNPQGF